jgi:hypothetical protein
MCKIKILFIFLSFNVWSQKENESNNQIFIKIDDTEKLNKKEAKLLNSLLKDTRDTVDLHGKKIAFMTGGNGGIILSKMDFFEMCINPWVERGVKPQISMILLSEDEKNQSRGYDIFVLSWVKCFSNKRKRKNIVKLRDN